GYSRIIGLSVSATERQSFSLSTSNGEHDYKIKNFGARAFLIENLPIHTIDHRILIDFKELSNERIPDIRGKSGHLPRFR
ncbi:hypothetical protein LCGC14_2110600, partial [marine sediment metagenome]